MNFVSVPLVTLFRPAFCPMTLPQIMALALSTDFKKYTLAFAFNELSSSEKDDKKSEYAETNISPMSCDDLLIGKSEPKEGEDTEKNRKRQDSVQIQKKDEEVQTQKLKKRQSYEKARSQITQAFESCQRSHGEQRKEEKKEVQDEISEKGKQQVVNQEQRVIGVRKQKRIKKIKRVQKGEDMDMEVRGGYISTRVSLIDTIDHPRITIDRFEIERKKENLLLRVFEYDEVMEQRKLGYQIRERRQLKKLS